jgi:predicted DCC family thiol-disulfide oxidoreductase YuxK
MNTFHAINRAIVFYDGTCGLCQRSIRFLSWADKSHKLHFAPLNGETYQLYVGRHPADLSSVLFYANGNLASKSDVIIALGNVLGGIYLSSNLLKGIPRKWRDYCYDLIAKNRHHITCQLLIHDERFLK